MPMQKLTLCPDAEPAAPTADDPTEPPDDVDETQAADAWIAVGDVFGEDWART